MDLNNQRESSNVDDQRGNSGGFGPGGSGGFGGLGGGSSMGGGIGMLLPLLFRTIGMRGLILLALAYFALKFFVGIDLINMVNGGGGGISLPGNTTQVQLPGNTKVGQSTNNNNLDGGSGAGQDVTTTDSGKVFKTF